MGIEKTKLLAHDSIYWPGMNNDTENHITIALHVYNFQQTQPKEKNKSPWNSRWTMESIWGRHVYPT